MEPVSWVSLGMVLQCLAFPVLPVSPDQTIYRIEREKKWHLWTSQDLSPGPSTAGCCFVFFWMWLSQIVCAWLFPTAAAQQKKRTWRNM